MKQTASSVKPWAGHEPPRRMWRLPQGLDYFVGLEQSSTYEHLGTSRRPQILVNRFSRTTRCCVAGGSSQSPSRHASASAISVEASKGNHRTSYEEGAIHPSNYCTCTTLDRVSAWNVPSACTFRNPSGLVSTNVAPLICHRCTSITNIHQVKAALWCSVNGQLHANGWLAVTPIISRAPKRSHDAHNYSLFPFATYIVI
jgi:hypothetical protein